MARAPVNTDPFEAMAAALPSFDEEDTPTLLQMGLRDPLPGCPMEIQVLPGGEKEMIEPGQWMLRGAMDPRTRLPIGCPVVPLGKDGPISYFLDTLGAVAELDAKSAGKGPIGAIFAGRSRWLWWAWPRWNAPKKDEDLRVVNWQAEEARQALFDACSYKGYFTLEDQVRGRGAWRDVDGSLIYHAGDQVFVGGKWRPCGEHGGYIYPGRRALGRPTHRRHPAGPGSAGDFLLEALRTFNWDRGELDARLMLGWLMTAKMGGALERRPVAFITGGEGSGKSTLQAMLRVVMNGALMGTSNTTQAGIYQRIQQDSVAIMVDEMADKGDHRNADRILELARIAYSGDSMSRGSDGGKGRDFKLNSSFLGSSIAKPATDSQDDSRLVVLMLRERESAGGGLGIDHSELDTIGRNLLRRIFDNWSRWDSLVATFRNLMISRGHKDRACDTFAPLAAGAHMALSDGPPTVDDLAQWGDWLAADTLAETSTAEKTWRRCLTYLLEAQPDVWRSGNKTYKSVAEVLNAYKESKMSHTDVMDYLPQVGLSISHPRGTWPLDYYTARLFVPAKHPALNRLFEGTSWSGKLGAPGPWTGVLRQAPREVWSNGKSDHGLDRKASGIFIELSKALEA